ncbi:MAG: hypothetical protein JWO13_53 [Acidobacteriales bacterium]|nr:hypothetical protein [Terriglobales bacterium]
MNADERGFRNKGKAGLGANKRRINADWRSNKSGYPAKLELPAKAAFLCCYGTTKVVPLPKGKSNAAIVSRAPQREEQQSCCCVHVASGFLNFVRCPPA